MEEQAKKFLEEYNALCEKYQMKIVSVPVFVPTNHGSFEITIKTSLSKIQKGEV